MTYTMTRKNRLAFYILAGVFLLMALMSVACGETCISRNDAGVCLETTSDVIAAPGEVLAEVADSFDTDGGISPFTGGSGEGICEVTGKNCD